MVDLVSAHIMIGGVLPRSQYPVIVQAIGNDNAAVDGDGTPFDPTYLPVNDPLTLMDHEVANGCFGRIEESCRRLGLHYVRWSGGYAGSFPSVRVIYGRVRQRGVNSGVASGLHFQAALGVICSG